MVPDKNENKRYPPQILLALGCIAFVVFLGVFLWCMFFVAFVVYSFLHVHVRDQSEDRSQSNRERWMCFGVCVELLVLLVCAFCL